MDFFGRQAATRRLSRRLVLLFGLAVVAVVVAVNLVMLFGLWLLQPEVRGASALDADWIARHLDVVTWTTIVVVGLITVASWYKTAVLSEGGGGVARSLGGERVTADTTDPMRRRLLNVVEEMAIASGVPMPEVYVLEHESGINAFAAGHNPANAAIAVTRGALERLDRDELQGVMAHEFSHILNGDMRLNIRLMALLFGLLVIALIARLVLRHAPRAGGGGRKGGVVALILIGAFAVMVLGYIGLFLGRLIQAAVSRARESLADASAVQFTRDPSGLRDALVKIGAIGAGSMLTDAEAEEVAHMLFAPGVRRVMATHPPLAERIRALDPTFHPREFSTVRARLQTANAEPAVATRGPQRGDRNTPAGDAVATLAATAVPIVPAQVVQLVGNPGTAHVRVARAIRDSLPDIIRQSASQPTRAAGLLLALVVDREAAIREPQLKRIENDLGSQAVQVVRVWLAVVDDLNDLQRLPTYLRVFPALRQLPRAERERLFRTLSGLLTELPQWPIKTYALCKLAQVQLGDEIESRSRPPGRLTLDAVQAELQVLFGVLAEQGSSASVAATQAYEVGMHHLLPRTRPAYTPVPNWPARLDAALTRLDDLHPAAKEQLVEALTKTIAHDLKLTASEAELLRTICAAVHCPLPPLLTAAAVIV